MFWALLGYLWTATKGFLLVLSPLIAYRFFTLAKFYRQFRKLRAQGIPSTYGRFNLVQELMMFDAAIAENPNAMDMSGMMRKAMKVQSLPPANLMC
jgi:hypothetical protein